MDFLKREDITDILHNGVIVGYIETDRNSNKRIQGYSISFLTEISGYDFGRYVKTYKSALSIAEAQYSKMVDLINNNPFYVKELDMFFPNEKVYLNFNSTPVAEQRRKSVLKRSEAHN